MLSLVLCTFFILKSVNSITLVLVHGAPDPETSFPSGVLPGFTFEECYQNCTNDNTCVLSYLNSASTCYIYRVGDVINIKKEETVDATEMGNQIAFKMQENLTCGASYGATLDGVINAYAQPPLKSYQFTTSQNPGYFTIEYDYSFSSSCSDWLDPVPTCDASCTVAMMSFRGIASATSPTAPLITTWKECVYACYQSDNCYVAIMKKYADCRLFGYGNVKSILRMDSTSPPTSSDLLNYLAIKYIPDSSTCSMNFTTMLTGGRTLKVHPKASAYSAYRPKTVSTQTSITWIAKVKDCSMPGMYTMPGASGCYMIIQEAAIYTDAVQKCASYGGDGLMTIPNKAGLSYAQEALLAVGLSSGYFTIGLTRADTSSPWAWTLPELAIDDTGMSWGTQQPGTAKYSYIFVMPNTVPQINGLGDSGQTTGILCHIPF